ncbi:MAG: PASTA domain-containing protein [Eggerthellaceae bacterium]|nr:PASTA domain-containing protein [Eggerthellaceae bacterium]
MICPHCQCENEADALFCKKCGHPLTDAATRPVSHGAQGSDSSEPGDHTVSAINESIKDMRSLARDLPEIKDPTLLVHIKAEENDAGQGRQILSAEDIPTTDKQKDPANTTGSLQNPVSLSAEVAELFPAYKEQFESDEEDDGIDLSGLETIIDSSYVPPLGPARRGDTLKLPVVENARSNEPVSYRTPFTIRGLRRKSRDQKESAQQARPKVSPERVVNKKAVSGAHAAIPSANKAETKKSEPSKEQAIPDAPEKKPEAAEDIIPEKDDFREGADIPAEDGQESEGEYFQYSTTHATGCYNMKAQKEPKKSRFSRNFKIAVLVIVIVVLVAGTSLGVSYQMQLWGGRSIPDVIGDSLADATYVLEQQGFAVNVEDVLSDDVEGVVIMTDPQTGDRAQKGSVITLSVSKSRVIPDVEGLTEQEAQDAFDAEGFDNITYISVKSDESEGTVLSVYPAAGKKASSTDEISVQVADPYRVPDVQGMSVSDATEELTDEGYDVEVEEYYTEDVDEGKAYGTDPEADSVLATGSTVTLYVAKSRAAECISFAHAYFQSATRFYYDINGGITISVDPNSLQVTYIGASTISYTIEDQEVTKTGILELFDTLAEPETISGTITFSETGNNIASDPSIKRAS